MLVPAAAPPVITPPPNLARAVYGGLVAPRQFNPGDLTGYNRDGAGGNAYGNNNDCYYGAGVDIVCRHSLGRSSLLPLSKATAS